MNTTDIKTKLAAALGWIKRQPRALLIPSALVAIVVVATLAASLHHNAPQAAVQAVPKAAQPTASQVLHAAVQRATQPATAPTAPGAGNALAIEAPALTPPAGLQQGFVAVALGQADQFGQYAQVAQKIEPAAETTFTARATYTHIPDWQQTWTAWFDLDHPASVAVLSVTGGTGTVSANIDGAPLGGAVNHWSGFRAQQATASVALAPGWHKLQVVTGRSGDQGGAGVVAQIALGAGTNPPAPVTPWAAPATPAPVAAEPKTTNRPVPAVASTKEKP
jgi:hypothetical protein